MEQLSCNRGYALRPIVVSCFMSMALGCSPADSPEDQAITLRDSAGIVIVENEIERLDATCTLDSVPSVSIGTAEGDDEYQLYRVFGARRLSDGTIALVNQGSEQVRFYDQTGQFVGEMGSRGRGPGEFRRAFQLWVLPGDTIWVGDSQPWRFLIFGPDRQWVRTVQPEPIYPGPVEAGVLNDGKSVVVGGSLPPQSGGNFAMTYVDVVLHGRDGSVIDTLGTFPDGRMGRIENNARAPALAPMFESHTRLTNTASHIAMGHTSRPEFSLLEVAEAARTTRIVRWTTGDRTVTSADIEMERERIREFFADLNAAMRRRIVEPQVSEDRPVADEFPAFAKLMAGRDGRIWVRDYTRPGNRGPHRWFAFDDAGRFECSVSIPRFDEIFEFGADYILVKNNDDLGVERVMQYRLGPPDGE